MKETSTCLSEERHVPASQSPDSGKDSKMRGAILRLSLQGWLFAHAPAGWSGKMSPEYCRAGKEAILPRSCLCSPVGKSPFRKESGETPESSRQPPVDLAWVGEYLTLNIPESNNFRGLSRSDGVVLSLSDILEERKSFSKYFLTENFARAILRRAEERGESLPPEIESACRSILRISTAG